MKAQNYQLEILFNLNKKEKKSLTIKISQILRVLSQLPFIDYLMNLT